MLGTLGKVASAAIMAAAVVTVAGAPASAGATAYNQRTVWLNGLPMAGEAPACTSKSIYLASGTYTWTQRWEGYEYASRDIYLAAGTYTWKDCLVPRDGEYGQQSSLARLGLPTAYLNEMYPQGEIRGTFLFGSLLDPHF
ncbi:hypothetical protein [Streptomyces tanashiensis]|uniref:hypothetical protein n=1 Tax=Streptomyces tanashiensis TaxID=67367 RepID=UPI0034071198